MLAGRKNIGSIAGQGLKLCVWQSRYGLGHMITENGSAKRSKNWWS
jgi:hypothetical protein